MQTAPPTGGALVQSVGLCLVIDALEFTQVRSSFLLFALFFCLLNYSFVCEFTQPFANAALMPKWRDAVCAAASSPDAQLRQASSYGVGVLAMHGGAAFAPAALAMLATLRGAITAEGALSEEHGLATDNAIVAYGKLLRFQGGALGLGACSALSPGGASPGASSPGAGAGAGAGADPVGTWASWLPLRFDAIEAQALHRLLVGVIVRVAMLGQPESALPPIAAEVTRTEAAFILGAQMSHLPALLSALGRALAYATSAEAAASGEEVMDEEALQIGSQCLGMAAGGGESALQAAAAKLDPRERGSWAV
jgi:hypothetical protein